MKEIKEVRKMHTPKWDKIPSDKMMEDIIGGEVIEASQESIIIEGWDSNLLEEKYFKISFDDGSIERVDY